MKCESCNISDIELEEPSCEGQNPYRLCKPCLKRLTNTALRPLEYFNLTAIHGHTPYLHDDFYNEEGEAEQPDIDVDDAENFPFPKLSEIEDDYEKLVDFAIVQYFISDQVINLIKQHDKNSILLYLESKVNYNRAIDFKAYEIAAKVLGNFAENWIRKEWEMRKAKEVSIYAIGLALCLPFDEAFEIITKEIENSTDNNFVDNCSSLLYFQNKKTLSWIEKNKNRIKNISTSWGTLAAASQFDWETANNWLNAQRPLSLIALDALYLCTSNNDRQNQALWLIKNPPTLHEPEQIAVMANRLKAYLEIDNVPRTRNIVDAIIHNLFETTIK